MTTVITQVSSIPTSTLIASLIALAFGLALLVMLFRARGAPPVVRPEMAGAVRPQTRGSRSPERASPEQPSEAAKNPAGQLLPQAQEEGILAFDEDPFPDEVIAPPVVAPATRQEKPDVGRTEEIKTAATQKGGDQAGVPSGLLTASMVLAIIGGSLGLLVAFLGSAFIGAAGAISGQNAAAGMLQLLFIASPVASIVGGVLVKNHPTAGAVCMIGSVLLPLHYFGLNFITILPVSLSGLAALFAFLGKQPAAKQS